MCVCVCVTLLTYKMIIIQSDYWAMKSTETTLLKVQNDCLLHFTINHAFLLSRLREMYGIHDQTLAWIISYLFDIDCSFRVPQGSVPEPML